MPHQSQSRKRTVWYPLYTVGDLSSGIYAVTPGILLMFYMTSVLGIPVAVATIASFVPKIVDLIAGPVIGALSDRSTSKIGRRRSYVLYGGLTILPAFTLLWASPFTSPMWAATFVVLAFCLCSLCNTSFSVPYCALNAEITTDYHDGTVLNSYRAFYSMVGCVIAGAGAPVLVEYFGGGRSGFFAMGATMAAIMATCILVTFFSSKEPKKSHVTTVPFKLPLVLKSIYSNKPYRTLMLAYFIHVIGSGIVSASLAFFVTYQLKQGADYLSLIFLLSFGSSVLMLPLFSMLGRRRGKFTAYSTAIGFTAVAMLGYFFLDDRSKLWQVLSVAVLAGFSEGGVQAFAYSMLSDSIRYGQENDTKLNSDAMMTGVFIAAEKLGMASGAGIAGCIFLLTGLVETTSGYVHQPESALQGIRLAASIAPSVLNVIALIVFSRYAKFDRLVHQIQLEPKRLV